METEEKNAYAYGNLELPDAHQIAVGSNSLITALQEYSEAEMLADASTARFVKKGVNLGDSLLCSAQILTSRGVFSKEKYLSEILIYSAAVVVGCEVCALTHIDGAVKAKVPESVIETVQTIALYIRAQADDETYLLFDSYVKRWKKFEDWPRLTDDRETDSKFYNLIALLMGLVVRKRRLVLFHTRELLKMDGLVKPEEVLEVVGIAQVMGGFPARWEAVHIFDVIRKLHSEGALPEKFVSVLNRIPK